MSTLYIISEGLYDAYTDLYLYVHSVIIYIFILVDDRFSVIACLLVSSISPAVKASLHQKFSSESLTTFIPLVIDVGLLGKLNKVD
jgi:hypothetical protein